MSWLAFFEVALFCALSGNGAWLRAVIVVVFIFKFAAGGLSLILCGVAIDMDRFKRGTGRTGTKVANSPFFFFIGCLLVATVEPVPFFENS